MTQELHAIRAHLLHYDSLLDNFQKSVQFVRDTPNTAMMYEKHRAQMEKSRELLDKECDILIEQIKRLEKERQMQDKRLQNVMNLVSYTLDRLDRFLMTANPVVGF
jgi:hypothetical protein